MLTILKHFLLTGIDGRKAIRRIAQPQPEGLRSSGLGAAPQQAEKPFVPWKRNGWFFAFVLQMHCLPVLYQIGYKRSKQCLWRAICETPRFHESGSEGFLLVEALPQSPQNTESVFWKRWKVPAATRFCKSLNGYQRPYFSVSLSAVRESSPRIRSTFALAVCRDRISSLAFW